MRHRLHRVQKGGCGEQEVQQRGILETTSQDSHTDGDSGSTRAGTQVTLDSGPGRIDIAYEYDFAKGKRSKSLSAPKKMNEPIAKQNKSKQLQFRSDSNTECQP